MTTIVTENATLAAEAPKPTDAELLAYKAVRLDNHRRDKLRKELVERVAAPTLQSLEQPKIDLFEALLRDTLGEKNLKVWRTLPKDVFAVGHTTFYLHPRIGGSFAFSFKEPVFTPPHIDFNIALSLDANNEAFQDIVRKSKILGDHLKSLISKVDGLLSTCRNLAQAVTSVPALYEVLGPDTLTQMFHIDKPADRSMALTTREVTDLITEIHQIT